MWFVGHGSFEELGGGSGAVDLVFYGTRILLDGEKLQLLEKVKGILGGLERNFEFLGSIGFYLDVLGGHVENDLFFIAGLHVFFLDGPDDLEGNGQGVREDDFSALGTRHESLEPEIHLVVAEINEPLFVVEVEEKFLVKRVLGYVVGFFLPESETLLVGVIEGRVDERVLEVLEFDLRQSPLDHPGSEHVDVVLHENQGFGQQVVAGS